MVDPEAQPAALALQVAAQLGSDWSDVDFPVLLDELGGTWGVLQQAKLFFTQEATREDSRAFRDPFVAEKMISSFGGIVPDFEVWQPLALETLVGGCRQLAALVRQALGMSLKEAFADQVDLYLAAQLLREGCWAAPPEVEYLDPLLRAYMADRGVDLPPRAAVVREFAATAPSGDLDIMLQARQWQRAGSARRSAS